MSCKDGIDRAGAASAYYNLIKSIQQGSPLSRQEFERAIHAAPALVKGRGMNYHAKILYNAIDYYLQAKQASNEKLPEGAEWLLEWRNDNIRLQVNKKKTVQRSVSEGFPPVINYDARADRLSVQSCEGAFAFYPAQSPDAETVLQAYPPDPGP